jgi:hypothetical protein
VWDRLYGGGGGTLRREELNAAMGVAVLDGLKGMGEEVLFMAGGMAVGFAGGKAAAYLIEEGWEVVKLGGKYFAKKGNAVIELEGKVVRALKPKDLAGTRKRIRELEERLKELEGTPSGDTAIRNAVKDKIQDNLGGPGLPPGARTVEDGLKEAAKQDTDAGRLLKEWEKRKEKWRIERELEGLRNKLDNASFK